MRIARTNVLNTSKFDVKTQEENYYEITYIDCIKVELT